MIDINELRRLAQAATPGPWWVNQDGLNHGFERGVAEINSKEWHALAGAWTINGAKHSEEGAANAEFIAAANPATITELLDHLEAAESSAAWHQRRWMALQMHQTKMREPERTMVCDIIANGELMHPTVAGDRYAVKKTQE